MDQEQSLRELDEQLEALLGGVCAPVRFGASVRSRVQIHRVTKLPEILDFIGWTGVLAALFIVAYSTFHSIR